MIMHMNSIDMRASTGSAVNAKLTGINNVIATSNTAANPMILIGGNSFRNFILDTLFCNHIANAMYENNNAAIK